MTALIGVADRLDPNVLEAGVSLHSRGVRDEGVGRCPCIPWLPDAYTEAPRRLRRCWPRVLETVAVYTVLRSKALVDQALRLGSAGNLLLTFGFTIVVIVVASLFILLQAHHISGCLPSEHRAHGLGPCSVLE